MYLKSIEVKTYIAYLFYSQFFVLFQILIITQPLSKWVMAARGWLEMHAL